ncbi:hypothetical protein BSNK01_02720 [Bacillaceae bacterium]
MKSLKEKNISLDIISFCSFLLMGIILEGLRFWYADLWLGFTLVLILSVLGYALFRYFIIKPIVELTGRSRAILEGDLTQEVAVKAIGSIGVLANTVNDMTESLRNLVIKIQSETKDIKEAAGILSEVANVSERATRELAASIEQSSANTQEQHANIEELQAAFEEINASVEEILSSAKQASAVATHAITTSQNGVNAVADVSNRLDLIGNSTESLQEIIKKLDEGSEQISEMVTLITHISEQTNLLALNAAIEAARAGEHGRGFAVVAGEVRKLAEESASAAKNIVKIVGDNQKNTQQAVDAILKIRDEVIGGQELAAKAKEALAVILNSSKEIEANSTNIASAVEQQSSAINDMTKSVEVIANSAQQIASAAQQATAAVEEQSAKAEELNASSSKLESLTQDLETLVDNFRTRIN